LSKKIKAKCERLDKSLILDHSFFPRAAVFISKHGLRLDYVNWLYDRLRKKQPKNLSGFFYKLFFQPEFADAFLAAQQPCPSAASKPQTILICPVCGASVPAPDNQFCPACDFHLADRFNKDLIHEAKAVWDLPADRRAAYKSALSACLEDKNSDLFSRFDAVSQLKKHFGIFPPAGD
jgi:hypothetical protein